ncbi:9887_t:CDS:2 [Paraglomus brasilianum]|uniref:9887_t:CDS:1 n=1 Tax=Paraglomus brasilianum TaxID=144538 RepID=A0A9N8ZAI9_9GLOM|nr:9887_t:CDS:2 [Paraglomus brasilianum]
MANLSKSFNAVNPLALAALLQPSPKLDRIVSFLNSVPGTDKVLMFIQYYSKIVIWFLIRLGKNKLAERVSNFANPVADFRILLRFYGLLPLVQWMIHIEHHPPPSTTLLFINRLQNLTMILYYPLEHIWWLAYHKVIDIAESKMNRIGIWSCRFWAAYVFLEFWALLQQWQLLKKKERGIVKKVDAQEADILREHKAVQTEKEQIVRSTLINVGYLPLTIHWSLENSSFPDVGVGFFGTLAAVYQTIGCWKSTA